MNDNRWDETWHRLREWTNGQARSERLAAQILIHEGYTGLDPSHPLGGKDCKKDALCKKDSQTWVMAVYFPRGQKSFTEIRRKFLNDLIGVKADQADGLAFVTNQELSLSERKELKSIQDTAIDLFHLERITAILDNPKMHSTRKQFLGIDFEGTADSKTPIIPIISSPAKPLFQEHKSNGMRTIYEIDPATGTRKILRSDFDY